MISPKRFASALALLLALVMLFSVLYVALEADHDCCGENCAVCARIRACENLFRNLLSAAALLLAVRLFCSLICVFVNTECFSVFPNTLISLKVKLSD